MKAAGLAVALDQRDDRHLAVRAAARALRLQACLLLLLAADIGLVDLNHLVLAA